MRFIYRVKAKYIVIAVHIITVQTNIASAMSITSKQNGLAIEQAAKTHMTLFIIYTLFLAATVIFSVLVWRSSNKYQEVVKREADSQIAMANATAGVAEADAAKANKKIKELEQLNLALKGVVAKLQITAADAQRNLLEIEGVIAPRIFEQNSFAEPLKEFKGVKVIIKAVEDAETIRTATQIASSLQKANWTILSFDRILSNTGLIMDGIRINSTDMDSLATKAAEVLAEQLENNKIKVSRATLLKTYKDAMPLDTILIMVGLKPQTYFSDKLLEKYLDEETLKILKDARDKSDEMHRKFRESRNDKKDKRTQ